MHRLPRRNRVYQHHHFDSTRWDYFESRADDIVIASSYKAGTTWTQAIVAHLLFPDDDIPGPPGEMSPWLDMRTLPLEVVLNRLKAQRHRRFIKTHLPLDGLPFEERLKYIYVSRDARDVFMSLWNHYTNHTEETFQILNATPGRVGDEFPRPPADIHAFWRTWATRGWFEWESDGWPYWSHFSNVLSWWPYRDLPGILFVHYSDLAKNVEREMRRIAAFLELEVPEEAWPRLVEAVSFAAMKRKSEFYVPGGGGFWRGGGETFLHKGTSGQWRGVLSEEELALYESACDRTLTPECRKWLENGGPV